MTVYKIFDLGFDAGGNPVPKTLFHGIPHFFIQNAPPPGCNYSIRRSRVLTVGQWYTAEHARQPKVVDPSQIEVLRDAELVADQWVVPCRLDHVLQKHPEATGIEHTGIIIKAMVEDVYKESQGEIVQSRAVTAAISKRAAVLWKQRVATLPRK